jgi:hypothetical protein
VRKKVKHPETGEVLINENEIFTEDLAQKIEELGIEVPKTWDEFTTVAEKIKAAGKIPFFHTYKDAWTTLPSFNALAANTQGDDFYSELNKGNILAGCSLPVSGSQVWKGICSLWRYFHSVSNHLGENS